MKYVFPVIISAIFFVSCSEGEATKDIKVDTLKENTSSTLVETVEFYATDSFTVTGNLYSAQDSNAKCIVLCHQAQFNKFEYAGVAERLVDLGFNCLAIDQRSGGPIGDQQNETNLRAIEEAKGVDYLDAIPDIAGAVSFMAEKFNQNVILWGSSYSSTLVLYEAVKNENVAAVVSFSPGNYFADTLGSLVPLYAEFKKPMFLTSGLWEVDQVSEIIADKELGKGQIQFIPEGEGHHGSRALWLNQNGGKEYWDAIESWLSEL